MNCPIELSYISKQVVEVESYFNSKADELAIKTDGMIILDWYKMCTWYESDVSLLVDEWWNKIGDESKFSWCGKYLSYLRNKKYKIEEQIKLFEEKINGRS